MTMREMLKIHREMETANKAAVDKVMGRVPSYKIVMKSWGGTKKDMYTDLTEEEAIEICEGYGWEVAPDGGYVWDLEVEEMD